MEPKYYTPELSEFFIGFEYELLQGYNVETNTFENHYIKTSINNIEDFKIIYLLYNLNKLDIGCRVKYLDQSDIESLGFIVDEMYGDTEFEYKNELKLPAYEYKSKVYLRYDYTSKICYLGTPGMTVFHGIIKNKSELKKILKMIGVIE